jgi:hypothetical protein
LGLTPCFRTVIATGASLRQIAQARLKRRAIIQAISRVNGVFHDKPHGLIVVYIGIGDELREATNRYTAGGGRGTPALPRPGAPPSTPSMRTDSLSPIRSATDPASGWLVAITKDLEQVVPNGPPLSVTQLQKGQGNDRPKFPENPDPGAPDPRQAGMGHGSPQHGG